MPRIIMKSPYFKPNMAVRSANHLRYIATRKGVELAPDTSDCLPATFNQKELIEDILKLEPEAKDLLEYEDYISNPTRGNASEFITQACEVYAATLGEREKYLSYIAERPGAEKIGKNGLFSDKGVPIVMSEIQDEIARSKSNVWTHIISLKREDAERLGYNTASAWMQLLRAHQKDFADNMRIAPENFRWFAAFHSEGHHPHVHMMAYSIKPKEAYLTSEGIESIKAALAKDIFSEERMNIYKRQTESRENIKSNARIKVRDLVNRMNQDDFITDEIANKLQRLAKLLAKTKGKLVYGYMPKTTKELIDFIVDEIEKDERIKKLYALWYESREDVLRQYTDTFPKRLPLSKNKEFKSIKNMVIHEALNIVLDGETASDANKYEQLKEKAEQGNSDAQYRLSRILSNPESKQHNPEEAMKWLKEAADRGNSNAQYTLGKMLLFGQETKKDYHLSRQYLEKSSEQGNKYAKQLIYTIDHDRNTFVAIGGLSLVRYAGSVIQNKTDNNIDILTKTKPRAEGKTVKKDQEKKESQGMRQSM